MANMLQPVKYNGGTGNLSAWGVAPGADENANLQQQNWNWQAGQAEKQRAFEGQQGAAQRANELQMAQLPWDYKNKVFGAVSPLLQGLMGTGQSGLVGGQNTPLPTITQGPVWSQQQIDQQVNAQKANNAQAANTQAKQAQQRVAASGFGANSPLLAALQGQAQMGRMAADATAQRETNWNAAQGNAQHLLDTQQAAQNQWAQSNQADIARRESNRQWMTSLAGMLAGMI